MERLDSLGKKFRTEGIPHRERRVPSYLYSNVGVGDISRFATQTRGFKPDVDFLPDVDFKPDGAHTT